MLENEFIQICQSIWPNIPAHEFMNKTYAGLIGYFETQTRSLSSRDRDNSISDVASVIRHLTSRQDDLPTRKQYIEMVRSVLSESAPESTVLRTADRALRILLTLDVRVGTPHCMDTISPVQGSRIDWSGDDSLSEVIENHFIGNSSSTTNMVTGRIDPSLSLPYLCTYRGFKIFWTSNLSEHLSISWKSKIITVYEHKVYLWNHLRNSNNPVIPRAVLEEAIDTLNLLFPLNDNLTRKFLSQNGKEFQGLGYCSRPRDMCLELGRFNIWRDRIAELAGIMNEEPKGLKQLVLEKDGRNLLPFVTFWIAIAVAFLSLLNIPFALVSMLYTIRQYQLALAQACSDPTVRDTLPHYCSPG